ncbi:hypothetical protein GWI33_021400 [Rhynchophorus ferrugineus]|uniref:Uncharacterized protein n=1 Tax=Rhynchophorus ferrugineus TaxID=354439 RepID=A0A834HMU7_RHYFE|nr:hypothetical protein GWI33_021400 [Rhynchophorus ferrugineus]
MQFQLCGSKNGTPAPGSIHVRSYVRTSKHIFSQAPDDRNSAKLDLLGNGSGLSLVPNHLASGYSGRRTLLHLVDDWSHSTPKWTVQNYRHSSRTMRVSHIHGFVSIGARFRRMITFLSHRRGLPGTFRMKIIQYLSKTTYCCKSLLV